jgi:putative FmdB family regulatory protein
MPIYEYECAACGHQFEEMQKMSDPPVRTCPKCKKKKVERLISRTAFQLKGGGWYADLYSSTKSGSGSGSGSGSSESGKSESKSSSEKSSGSDKGSTSSGSSSSSDKGSTKKADPRAA